MTLSYKRDFNISGDKVDITTLNTGRKQYQLRNYNYAKSVLCRQWKYAASKVCRHRNGCYYFHLSLERGVALPNLDVAKKFMGVDVGINHIAVAASTVDGSRFFRGGRIKNLRNCYCGMRARLQSKGTLSSKRVLKHLGGKEKRLMRCVNHAVSKELVAFAKEQCVDVIGLEDLKGIRGRTVVRRGDRYRHSSWAFRELQTFIEYKAIDAGINVVYIDGSYTSQKCTRCGYTSRNNRHRLRFLCQSCGFCLNADLIAARNIEHRARDFRYSLKFQGRLSAAQTDACS